ncbi:DUF4236 domain-containing protein [Oxalobacteraceae bacterium OM1]|nr:DUF4236 domain-containing protein [Oxalobacteraceae bacterium OM1]
MGFRFRKSVKVLPGVRLNFSKSGMSTSIGGKGLTVNVKKGRKTRTTISLPGTGLSHTSYSGTDSTTPGANGHQVGFWGWVAAALLLLAAVKLFS